MTSKIKKLFLIIHRQRMLTLLVAVVFSLTLVLGSTYSWFVQNDETDNVLETKELMFTFKAVEEFVAQQTVEPGQSVTKKVDVKNTGDISGFVRVLVLAEIISADGVVLVAVPGTTFSHDGLNITDWSAGNSNLWADGGDGYYYYLDKLDAGQTTLQPLFNGVTLSGALGDEYNDAEIKIYVKVEATELKRDKYRNGWWLNGDIAPSDPTLIRIDDVLKEKAI